MCEYNTAIGGVTHYVLLHGRTVEFMPLNVNRTTANYQSAGLKWKR